MDPKEKKASDKNSDVITVKHNAQEFYESKVGEKVDTAEKVKIKFTKDYIKMKEGRELTTNRTVADIYLAAGVAEEIKK